MADVSTKQLPSDDENALVVISEKNAPNIHNVLKTLLFRECGFILASQDGIKVVVEEFKSVQAIAYLKADLFTYYRIKEDIQIKLNLQVLCDCLNLFGSGQQAKPSVKITYEREDEPLRLILEDENGIVTVCAIKTLDLCEEDEEVLDFEFQAENAISKIIMKAEALRETFSELDATSDLLEISVNPPPEKPNLRITTKGSLAEIHHDFVQSSMYVEKFSCLKKHSNKYRLSLLKPTGRVLQQASKISLRTDSRGFLSLQYMLEFDSSGQFCFVEFYCSPEVEYDD